VRLGRICLLGATWEHWGHHIIDIVHGRSVTLPMPLEPHH
jgi:hypothetical protein